MAVEKIEVYGDVLKVILKPTKIFTNGYFYTDNNPVARELVESYSWSLAKHNKNTYVVAVTYGGVTLRFYQEYAKKVLGYYPDCVDHISGLEIDNRDYNLNIVTSQQNSRNRPSLSYTFDILFKRFRPRYSLNCKDYFRGSYKSEPEALLAVYNLRQEVYSDYDYNFYLDRRDDEDIVDLELTKKITSQEAIYLHVKRYVENNPWYAYRYNLFDYCKQNNIVISSFSLDSQGFMIDKTTGKRLCPY